MLSLQFLITALHPPFLSGNPATATAEMIALGVTFMVLTFAVFVIYGVFAAIFAGLGLRHAFGRT